LEEIYKPVEVVSMGNDPEFHLNIHSTSLNEEKENVTLMDSAVQTDPIL